MKLTNNWIHGDCLKELKKIPDESVHLVVTSPPYHNLRVYSNDPCDLSNCETYEEYYYLLGLVIAECKRVLVPGGKFVIQYEDYNYTLGRDGKNGQESLTGAINDIFLDNGFSLWTKAFWRKYSAQRAMLAQGNLYYRNMKARDTILAANVGFVYVYKKEGDLEVIKGSDITLAEWADWADGVWNIPNSGISHSTPFAEEFCMLHIYRVPPSPIRKVEYHNVILFYRPEAIASYNFRVLYLLNKFKLKILIKPCSVVKFVYNNLIARNKGRVHGVCRDRVCFPYK